MSNVSTEYAIAKLQSRMDAMKCKGSNKPCGERCIPQEQNCKSGSAKAIAGAVALTGFGGAAVLAAKGVELRKRATDPLGSVKDDLANEYKKIGLGGDASDKDLNNWFDGKMEDLKTGRIKEGTKEHSDLEAQFKKLTELKFKETELELKRSRTEKKTDSRSLLARLDSFILANEVIESVFLIKSK